MFKIKNGMMITSLSLLLLSSCVKNDTGDKKALNITMICSSCHGDNGISEIPIYPNLKGKSSKDIALALKSYRDKSRKGKNAEVMYAVSAGLTDEDIEVISQYYGENK